MVESDAEERERFITAWIAMAMAKHGTPTHEENFWAFERLDDLTCCKPEEAWDIILDLAQCALPDKAISLLAAGPLEDLMAKHGEAFIDRVVLQARRDPAFNYLLGGVWQNATSDAVWQRVEAIRNTVW